MKKTIRIITSCVLITSTLTGCTTNKIAKENKIEKVNNLGFEFEVNPNNFAISLEIDNKKEIISNPIKDMDVTNLKESENEISWSYPNENIDVSIKKENKYLDVDISSTTKEENTFSWPKVNGESYTLPIQEGKFIPSNDKYWKEFLDDTVYNVIENFSMQFFSVNKENFAATYIIKNKFNNEIKFDTKNDINFTFTHEYPNINENKTYGFRIYATEKNVVDIAKTYKNYIVEQGEFETLSTKAKENENIEKLYGAPHIYFWDKSVISQDDIKWNILSKSISKELENHLKNLLSTQVEDGKESINVFDAIKVQDYVDKYQKSQIVMALNKVMLLEDFYNPNVFKNVNKEDQSKIDKGTNNLTKIELVELNKSLLKSELKNATTPTKDWAKHNTVDIIDEMKESGIENAWIGFDDYEAGYISPT
ncbi:MAG: glycoside hydrolase, partial [Peptostreptococcaceae bacterium]